MLKTRDQFKEAATVCFRISGEMKHAMRTYRGALTVFKGTKWSHIRDHVHFHIGKWYAFLGMFDVAINHILEVLACGHQSKTTQELFLRDFFQIVQMENQTETKDTYKQHQQQQLQSRPAGAPPSTQAGGPNL